MDEFQDFLDNRNERDRKQLLISIFGGLEAAVEHAGGILTGVSIKFSGDDTFMTLKAEFPGGNMVSFCGARDLPSLFIKARSEAGADRLKWRQDEFFKVVVGDGKG